jgi:hypothetical protein
VDKSDVCEELLTESIAGGTMAGNRRAPRNRRVFADCRASYALKPYALNLINTADDVALGANILHVIAEYFLIL